MARLDPHSHTDLGQPHQKHLSWKAEVDFAGRTLRGTATLRFDRGGSPVDLDSRGLVIESVTAVDGGPLRFELGSPEPILGERLRVELPPGVDICIMRGGSPECVDPKTLASTEGIQVSFGGCGCKVGGADRSGAPWLLLAPALWLLRRRREVKR